MNPYHERYIKHQRELDRQQARLRQRELVIRQIELERGNLPVEPPEEEGGNLIYFDESFSLDIAKLCGSDEEKEAEAQRFVDYLCSLGMTMKQVEEYITELKTDILLYIYEQWDFDEDEDGEAGA